MYGNTSSTYVGILCTVGCTHSAPKTTASDCGYRAKVDDCIEPVTILRKCDALQIITGLILRPLVVIDSLILQICIYFAQYLISLSSICVKYQYWPRRRR